jgi:hypothetical protein
MNQRLNQALNLSQHRNLHLMQTMTKDFDYV